MYLYKTPDISLFCIKDLLENIVRKHKKNQPSKVIMKTLGCAIKKKYDIKHGL